MIMNLGNQLEMFKKEGRLLENVPEYEAKLKAWEYLHMSPEERKEFIERILRFGDHYPSPDRAAINLSNKAGFPLLKGVIKEERVRPKDDAEILDFCKDILDEHGEILPSRDRSKAA